MPLMPVENVRKIQSYGIQVQAGMIVGFDHDDATIFEEQLRFIQDARIPVPLMETLKGNPDLCIGDNEPYSGRHPNDYTIDFHAESPGLANVGIEVRQDLVNDQEGAKKWAGILGDAFELVLQDPSIYQSPKK